MVLSPKDPEHNFGKSFIQEQRPLHPRGEQNFTSSYPKLISVAAYNTHSKHTASGSFVLQKLVNTKQQVHFSYQLFTEPDCFLLTEDKSWLKSWKARRFGVFFPLIFVTFITVLQQGSALSITELCWKGPLASSSSWQMHTKCIFKISTGKKNLDYSISDL